MIFPFKDNRPQHSAGKIIRAEEHPGLSVQLDVSLTEGIILAGRN